MSTCSRRWKLSRDGSSKLIDVGFAGETTDYETFRVHRKSVLAVRGDGGEPRQLRLFGSVIEYAGRVQVFSYVVD